MRNVGTEHCWLVSARNLDGFVQDPWLQIPSLPRCLNHTHTPQPHFFLYRKAAAHFLILRGGREMSIIPQVGILIRCLADRYSKTFLAFPICFQGCINLCIPNTFSRLHQSPAMLFICGIYLPSPAVLIKKNVLLTWYCWSLQWMQSKESEVVAF